MRNQLTRAWRALIRWQEAIVQLPLLALLAVGAWVVLGALDRTATQDMLALLVLLPVYTAYGLAACALTYLVRRRWRRKLSEDEQTTWWATLIQRPASQNAGARLVYLIDAVVTLGALIAFLLFFSQAL